MKYPIDFVNLLLAIAQGYHQHAQQRSLSMSALRQPGPPELLSAYAPPPGPLPTPTPTPAATSLGLGLGSLPGPAAAAAAVTGGGKVVPFLLADIGEGIAEVEMMQWFVREGESVKQFDRICEVQSDKATVEISSRYDGVVRRVHHGVGAIVKVRWVAGVGLCRAFEACLTPCPPSFLPSFPFFLACRSAPRSSTLSCQVTRRRLRPRCTTPGRLRPRCPRRRRP